MTRLRVTNVRPSPGTSWNGTPLLGNYAEYLRTGEGRWRVDLMAARWAPSDGEFDRIDAVAERLERSLRKLSAPDDEMTV